MALTEQNPPEPGSKRRRSPSTRLTSSASGHRPLAKSMTCEIALQTVLRTCIVDLRLHGQAAADGDTEALHQMRIALTRLRTAIRFFSPAIDDPGWKTLRRQAAWLSRQSNGVRDIDVALERQLRKGSADPDATRWRKERDTRYERLRSALRSVRYRRFILALSRRGRLPEHGSFPVDQERPSLGAFSTKRLDQWRRRLLTKGRKLERLGRRKRHRLRTWAKRFRYALEWSLPLFAGGRTVLREQIRLVKIIQKALGTLNDASTHHAQARALRIDPLPVMARLERQNAQRHLLGVARRAFDELERSKHTARTIALAAI